MRAYWVLVLALLLASMPFSSALDRPDPPPSDADAIKEDGNGPLPSGSPTPPVLGSGFKENRGQLDDDAVLFYAITPERGIAFLMSEVRILIFAAMNPINTAKAGSCIQLTFPGSNDVNPEGCQLENGTHSVFLGNDRARWKSDIRGYQEILYRDIYKGVDLIYKTEGGALKYEFHLDPNIDPSVVRVQVNGHEGLQMDLNGDLVIRTENGDLRDGGLAVFYSDDPHAGIPASFALEAADTYRFEVGAHDPGRGLVIDPVIFSTFLGGEGDEYCNGVVVDDDMSMYLTGLTYSVMFPRMPGNINRSVAETTNVFVCKLTGDGVLVFSAIVGGSSTDEGTGIAIDSDGNVYVTGSTLSQDFPVTNDSLGPVYMANYDGFVLKLGGDGSRLDFSTYLGGWSRDWPKAITVDGNGDVFVVGNTRSANFPTTEGAFQVTLGGNGDAFLARVANNGSTLIYASFLGGIDDDYGNALALDEDGAVYVAGDTKSRRGFPVTSGAYGAWLSDYLGNGFITKFEPDGSKLNFSARLGGLGTDECNGITIDVEGNVLVCGTTYSNDFPTTEDAYEVAFCGGNCDGFVSMLSPDGRILLYSTFIGGNQTDFFSDIGVNSTGCVFLTGYTLSNDLPTTDDAFKPVKGGFFDALFIKLVPGENRTVHSTFLGGSENDYGMSLSVVKSDIVYVAGHTHSDNFHTTIGAYQPTMRGPTDCFIVGFNTDNARPVANAGPDRIAAPHDPAVLNGSSSFDNVGIVNWTWSFTIGEDLVEFYGPETEFTFHIPGVYVVELRVQDEAGHLGRDTVHVVVPDAGADIVTTVGSSVWFAALGSSVPIDTIDWSWTFSFHGTRKVLVGPVFDFIFDRTGVFQVALNVTDSQGNRVDDGFTMTVLTEDGSLADAGPDVSVDQDAPLHLETFDQMEGIMVWTWRVLYNGSWVVMTGSDPNMTFHLVGTYKTELWMRDTNGAPHSDTMTITVIDRKPPVAIAGADLVVDQFTTVDFNGSASIDNVGIVEWVFSFLYEDRAVYLYDVGANFTFDVAGEYTVYLMVADDVGNNDMDNFNLTVLDITPPVAFAGSGQMVDQHTTVSFVGGGSSDNVGVVNWTWNFSYDRSEVTLFGGFPSYFFDDAGSYPVTLTVRDLAGLNDTDVITIVVLDTTSPLAFAGENVIVKAGDAIRFNGTNSTDNVGIVNYTWTFDYRGSPITLYGEAPEFKFEKVGEYLVTLVVLDGELHSSSDSLRVFVKEVEETCSWDDNLTMAVVLVVVAALGLFGWRWSRRGSK